MSAIIRLSPARGFTLIEVLIGVLVLALGLLGLGAIIPVVIREQRAAVTMTLGDEAAHAAKNYLLGRRDLDPSTAYLFNRTVTPNAALPTVGWDVWLRDYQNWSPLPQYNAARAYLWEPWKTAAGNKQEMALTPATVQAGRANPGDFGWRFPRPSPPGELFVTISLADRLWPNESTQGDSRLLPGQDSCKPLFVWDFIGRRVQVRLDPVTGRPVEPEQLQIAIFVRPLDMNIRIPRGNHPTNPGGPITLRDVVLNRGLPSPTTDARVPVCSAPAQPANGQELLPTNTGVLATGVPSYSELVFLGAQFDPGDPERIEFFKVAPGDLSRNDNAWKLISQTGQKIVDNLGNVYTVRGLPDDLEPGNLGATTEVLVDPPVPAWVPDPASVPNNSPGLLRQVVFAPQIPAAIEVFTITRAVPNP